MRGFPSRVTVLAEGTEADWILLGGWEHNGDFRDIILEAGRENAILAPRSALVVKSRDSEREQLVSALQRTGGNKAEAARLLGIPRSTFFSKLKKHSID